MGARRRRCAAASCVRPSCSTCSWNGSRSSTPSSTRSATSTSRARAAGRPRSTTTVARGADPGIWAGVPMGVKELVQVKGWPDTHGSLLYRDAVGTRDDTEPERLKAAGAVLVGLTTSPEFGSTNWTRTYLHGTTRNPWNPERTPGGSSGGSAAAVASGMMPICTGSDGGGSIRIPSAYSGLFGFKTSFGRVGYAGNFDSALTSVPGPMCRTVRDAARYVDAVAGPTNNDPDLASASGALVRGRGRLRRRGRAAARQAGRVVGDARLRGVRPRGREAHVRGRARAVCRRRHRAGRRRRPAAAARRRVGPDLVARHRRRTISTPRATTGTT